jgi:hypothetical protein
VANGERATGMAGKSIMGVQPMSFKNANMGETPMIPQSPLFPVLVWVGLQLIALGLSAAHVPFYAMKSFPRPAEVLASGVMLTIQITASAMLFPFLMRDRRTAGLIIVASWPFTLCSLLLTGYYEPRSSAQVMGYVTVWLMALSLWTSILRSSRAQPVGIAVAMLATAGGAVLCYVQAEYGAERFGVDPGYWGPLMGSFAVVKDLQPVWSHWIGVGALFCLAAGIKGVARMWVFSPGPQHAGNL